MTKWEQSRAPPESYNIVAKDTGFAAPLVFTGHPGPSVSCSYLKDSTKARAQQTGDVMMRTTLTAVALALVLAFASFGADAAQKDQVSLTVYNSDLALVRIEKMMEIPLGEGEVLFPAIPSRIMANTVLFESLSYPSKVRVKEQNYEYDLVSEYKLLQKFVDQKITVVTKGGQAYAGFLMSGSNSPVILSEKEAGKGEIFSVQLSDIQSIRYPGLPDGLITRPTLRWMTVNNTIFKNQQVKVTFLTAGLSWSADYVALLAKDEKSMDLTGWVTLVNSSGATYPDAKLKLVAGDVNRVTTQRDYAMMAEAAAMPMVSKQAFEERGLFEYHLYDLQFPTTLKDNQTKQIGFMQSEGIPVTKTFMYTGRYDSQNVGTYIEFRNDAKSKLGMPLPAGVVRVNKQDADGSEQFIGEDRIGHTPKDEDLALFLGNAFDIKGSWQQDSFRDISKSIREETYTIEIRNHKDEAVKVKVRELLSYWSEWSIVSSTMPFTKLNSTTIQFEPTIAANGTAKVTYTVRYTR